MTIGEKIRKYRKLRGLTQKELGEKVGFKKSTADVRINQYETNKMAPKSDIRSAIAENLDIDLEAISEINISSWEDIMFVFFELEEKYGMDIEKKDGRTYLSFDDKNRDIQMLITYLNLWQTQKRTFQSPDNNTDSQENAYLLWKSRFFKNVDAYFKSKTQEIDSHYTILSEKSQNNYDYAKTTSDLARLLRSLIENGFTISFSYTDNSAQKNGLEITFFVKEILNPISEAAESLFTHFWLEMRHLKDLGIDTSTIIQMPDKALTITYSVPIASFSIIGFQLDGFIKHYQNINNESDFSRDTFETLFENDLKKHYNIIQDEIDFYNKKK